MNKKKVKGVWILNKKKILFIIITALFALSLLKYPAFADDGWDGITEVEPQGSGTLQDPYLIGTPEELAWYRTWINEWDNQACAKLIADIDLNNKNWTPIGLLESGQNQDLASFSGDFDGGNHTISGLYIEHMRLEVKENLAYGFFGYVKGVSNTERAAIHDLVLTGSVQHAEVSDLSGTKARVGGLCGQASSADISRCKVNVEVTVIEPSSVEYTPAPAGGICGNAENVNIIDCINYGNITGAGNAGGLIGCGTASLTRSANYGDVQAGKGHAGGFFGYLNATNETCTISYCYNTGNISSTGRKDENGTATTEMKVGGNAGGFFGYGIFVPNGFVQMIYSHCFSTGTISANKYAGSIAGVSWDYAQEGEVSALSLTDVCYLDTSCNKIIGSLMNLTGSPITATSLTARQMASADYVAALNESAGAEIFAAGLGHPVFKGLDETPAVTKGDIDGNGRINAQDVTFLIGYVLGTSSLEDSAKAAADMNNDTRINGNDVTELIQLVLH